MLTGFPTVMLAEKNGMFMIWCEIFRCATIGRYIKNKIVRDANSICFMMWQESPTMSHVRKSRPKMPAFTMHLNDTVTASQAPSGPSDKVRS